MSNEEITLIEERMLTLLSKIIISLDNEKHDPNKPDLFGQSFTVLFDSMFHALMNNRPDFVGELFPSLIVGTERARNRLIRDLDKIEVRQRLGFVTSPIIGLMELSGYVILTSEFYANDAWERVKPIWDRCLSPSGFPGFADQMMAALQYHESFVGGDRAGLERTRRRMEFDTLLRSKGIVQLDAMYGEHVESQTRSPALAAFAPTDVGGLEEPMDLFAVDYLARRDGFDMTTLPRNAQLLRDLMERNND